METAATLHPIIPLIFPTKNVKESMDSDTAWRFYSHSIRRKPGDLKLHTHRVFFAIKNKNAERIAGSLHDLFYILKGSGENLRIRLLKASMPYLDREETLYFAMWIKLGINKGLGYKWIPCSVLSDGLYGPDQTLIDSIKVEKAEDSLSTLEQARSCMEYGQLNVAKTILEEALESEAGSADIEMIQDELNYLLRYSDSIQIEPNSEKTKSRFGNTIGKIKNKIFS